MFTKACLFVVLNWVSFVNARHSMNGVYVNGNTALAIVCYSVVPSRGEIMTVITGSISDMPNLSTSFVWVLGWSDSCRPTQENPFILSLQNKTQELRTVWYIYFQTENSIHIQPKVFIQYDGYEAFRYSNPMVFRYTNDQIIWLERLD